MTVGGGFIKEDRNYFALLPQQVVELGLVFLGQAIW